MLVTREKINTRPGHDLIWPQTPGLLWLEHQDVRVRKNSCCVVVQSAQNSLGSGPVAPHSAEVKGLLAICILGVDISPSVDQSLDAVFPPLAGCFV